MRSASLVVDTTDISASHGEGTIGVCTSTRYWLGAFLKKIATRTPMPGRVNTASAEVPVTDNI